MHVDMYGNIFHFASLINNGDNDSAADPLLSQDVHPVAYTIMIFSVI